MGEMLDKDILQHIMREITFALGEIQDLTEADFMQNATKQHALVMALLNIGELANNLNYDFYLAHPNVPWRKIIDMRNAAAHGYFSLKLPLIWNTLQNDLPKLQTEIQQIQL
ncbi:MAG: DUF86 domain-containing protein [Candidatus Nomurabacteria bacterium]|jgi:uncharacterized protein with HEPN domain|nr:DUF86 domain-containing protein [Candidatus Nomurabacteria bacterium]